MLNIKSKVVHSQSKPAWNVVGTQIGGKYKIARFPYVVIPDEPTLTTRNRQEALKHAEFFSKCLNNEKFLEAAEKFFEAVLDSRSFNLRDASVIL